MFWRSFVLVTAVALAGCDHAGRTHSSTTSSSPAAADPATLLTADELQKICGEPLKQATPSTHIESGFSVAECYFLLQTPSKSVVLTVTARAPGSSGESARDFWFRKFHSESGAGSEAKEKERPGMPPEKIDGLGDEAFWVNLGSMGTLYVLQRDAFLRVAIGGADDKPTRLKKSTALAQLILPRL